MQNLAIEDRLSLFREMITCGHQLYFWSFDADCAPIFTNCPASRHFRELLGLDKSALEVLLRLSGERRPVLMTNRIGLVWIADFAFDEQHRLTHIHGIGPVSIEEPSRRSIDKFLHSLDLFGDEMRELRALLLGLPVLSITRFYDFGLMLHYCLSGEKITISDIQYPKPNTAPKAKRGTNVSRELHGTWVMEQELLRLIEEGNLDYKQKAARMVTTGQIGQLGNGDPVRNLKNLTIIFTALCTRAAIRGGLTPEIAYTLSDNYISSIETSVSLAEIAEVNAAMQDDFVQRVHQARMANANPQIENCCHYLQLHCAEPIRIPALAQKMGYSPSHLTRLFKRETGMTILDYVRCARMEQAKDALRLSGESVQSICHRLGFGSQSYFGKQFREATGMSPTEYREKHGQCKI